MTPTESSYSMINHGKISLLPIGKIKMRSVNRKKSGLERSKGTKAYEIGNTDKEFKLAIKADSLAVLLRCLFRIQK